jgi:hypothetical protein
MQFPPYNESFLDLSLWILFACSAAAGLGGLMLLALRKWGIPLVVWQARISIVINTAVVVLIVAIMIGSARERRPEAFTTLELRIGSIVIDLLLWMFLRTSAVREFFVQRAHPLGHAFEVITDDAPSGAAHSSTCSHDLER